MNDDIKYPKNMPFTEAEAIQMIEDMVAEHAAPLFNQTINQSWERGWSDGYAAAYRDLTGKEPEHVTHIHKVEIKVNSNQDPSRIAKLTIGLLREMAEKHCKTT